jgi:hypothetical protein
MDPKHGGNDGPPLSEGGGRPTRDQIMLAQLQQLTKSAMLSQLGQGASMESMQASMQTYAALNGAGDGSASANPTASDLLRQIAHHGAAAQPPSLPQPQPQPDHRMYQHDTSPRVNNGWSTHQTLQELLSSMPQSQLSFSEYQGPPQKQHGFFGSGRDSASAMQHPTASDLLRQIATRAPRPLQQDGGDPGLRAAATAYANSNPASLLHRNFGPLPPAPQAPLVAAPVGTPSPNGLHGPAVESGATSLSAHDAQYYPAAVPPPAGAERSPAASPSPALAPDGAALSRRPKQLHALASAPDAAAGATPLAAKVLTESDVKHARAILPRIAVENNLPFLLGYRTFGIVMPDADGTEWEFNIKSWANGRSDAAQSERRKDRRVYVIEQMAPYLAKHQLRVGDVIGIVANNGALRAPAL